MTTFLISLNAIPPNSLLRAVASISALYFSTALWPAEFFFEGFWWRANKSSDKDKAIFGGTDCWGFAMTGFWKKKFKVLTTLQIAKDLSSPLSC